SSSFGILLILERAGLQQVARHVGFLRFGTGCLGCFCWYRFHRHDRYDIYLDFRIGQVGVEVKIATTVFAWFLSEDHFAINCQSRSGTLWCWAQKGEIGDEREEQSRTEAGEKPAPAAFGFMVDSGGCPGSSVGSLVA